MGTCADRLQQVPPDRSRRGPPSPSPRTSRQGGPRHRPRPRTRRAHLLHRQLRLRPARRGCTTSNSPYPPTRFSQIQVKTRPYEWAEPSDVALDPARPPASLRRGPRVPIGCDGPAGLPMMARASPWPRSPSRRVGRLRAGMASLGFRASPEESRRTCDGIASRPQAPAHPPDRRRGGRGRGPARPAATIRSRPPTGEAGSQIGRRARAGRRLALEEDPARRRGGRADRRLDRAPEGGRVVVARRRPPGRHPLPLIEAKKSRIEDELEPQVRTFAARWTARSR